MARNHISEHPPLFVKSNAHSHKHVLPLPLLLFFFFLPASAQNSSSFKINGSIGLFYDGYDYSQVNYETFRPKFPEHLLRFSAHTTLSFGKYFSMPIGIDVTNQQVSYILPTLPEERFIDYIQNPRNNVSINPRYKWAQAFIGTHVPSYSTLTTGDIPVFGAGIHLQPGKFIFSFNYGRSQAAVNASPFENIIGAFEQRLLASRIGIGKEEGSKFVLQLVKLTDEPASIQTHPSNPKPVEGITLAPLLQLKIGKHLFFKSETAGSIFTRDQSGAALPLEMDILNQINRFITINNTSNADFSNISGLEWKSDAVLVGAEVRYIGPGFQSMGYRTMERDLIDYTFKTDLKLFQNNMILSGTAGMRTNNLRNTTLETTNRLIANVNLYTRFSDAFSVNTTYSNFGFRNNVIFDTLKVEMIQNSFSINPTLQFKNDAVNHVITGGASAQLFDEYSYFNGASVATQSTSFNLNYNLVFSSIPLMLGAMGMYLDNETPDNQMNLYNIGINARYRLFNKKLTPSVQLSYSGITRNDDTPDNRTRLNFKTEYKITQKLVMKLAYTWSNYRYGSSRPNALTNEHRFQVSIGQQF